jgi:hypothetical protein
MAVNLKNLSFYGWFPVQDRQLTTFMEWLLDELTDPQRMPLGTAKDSQRPSNLAAISVRLPVRSSNGMKPAIAGALSEVFLDRHHYPMLKNVLIHLAAREASSAMLREEVELAMLPCTQKGILSLLWQ